MLSEERVQADLSTRTKDFALRVIRLVRRLPRDPHGVSEVIAKQVLRSGTSVGAQYREACRARSRAEFISKIDSAAQELDETLYWFELIRDAQLLKQGQLDHLADEAQQLLSILLASSRTAKSNR